MKALFLNCIYLILSCTYTYSSWTYKGIPEVQLLLQSLLKIFFVTIICFIHTRTLPKISFGDKYMVMAAIVYSGSSLCTTYLWNQQQMTPYMYSMGTKPTLAITNVIQYGIYSNFVSFFSVLGFIFVKRENLLLFLLKCLLSSLGSYLSSLGLDYGKKSEFQDRCTKIVSFSLISALIPLYWSNTIYVQHNNMEYIHAILGALNGLSIAFVLSYNGALTKVGLSSIKDIVFLASSNGLTSLNVMSLCFQGGISCWVSFQPVQEMENIKNIEVIEESSEEIL
jgi:hypothetical protein